MNGRQKRHEAKLRARLFAAYMIFTIDVQTVYDQPEWFQDMFLEEMGKIADRLRREAERLAERNGTDLPEIYLANHYKK